MAALQKTIPNDAVLLIPEPEDENTPAPYGVTPGYYNSKRLLQLLNQHHREADTIHYIADMLETGNPENDEFAAQLRVHHADPVTIFEIIKGAGG